MMTPVLLPASECGQKTTLEIVTATNLLESKIQPSTFEDVFGFVR